MGDTPTRRATRPVIARSRSTTPSSTRTCRRVAGGGEDHEVSSEVAAAMPSGVPTTTAVSPAVNRNSGPGAGWASSSLITATMETPVRLRTSASAIVRSTNADVVGSSIQSMARPSMLLLHPGQALDELVATEEVGHHLALLRREDQLRRHRVGDPGRGTRTARGVPSGGRARRGGPRSAARRRSARRHPGATSG